MARVYWINENGCGGLNLSGSGASRSVLITNYAFDNITNNEMEEASVMDMRQETLYVVWLRKCEGKKQLGRTRSR